VDIIPNAHYIFQRTYHPEVAYALVSVHLDTFAMDIEWETIVVGSGFSYSGIAEEDKLKIRRTWDSAIEIDGKILCANLSGEIIGTFTTLVPFASRIVPITHEENHSANEYLAGFAEVTPGQLEFFNHGVLGTNDILEIHVKIYYKP
jgi:hypothetical protein